jgi:hypothetical protein
MPFKRYVEIGRVCMINFGEEYGQLVVISDVIDQNRVSAQLRPMRSVAARGSRLQQQLCQRVCCLRRRWWTRQGRLAEW